MRISDWSSDVCSSDLANGRYSYGRQPQIMHWNMARFAEALLPAIHRVSPDDVEAAKALVDAIPRRFRAARSEEHTSELQSLMRISYAVFCLKKKNNRHS